ncbi:MAG: Crp/Fnr family transcriptional regulator [Oscillospiraceae bacterium]|nr:Crp/Fnr family transcriptional regulator [Oscillospiraceae bacterium]
MEKYLPLLERTALFEGVARQEIAALCRVFDCRLADYRKGNVILCRGEKVENAGLVLSGAVQAERNGADGTLRIVARQGALALFGDVLCVSRLGKSPVDVVAAEEGTEVLFVPLGAIMRSDAPELGEALARVRVNLLHELAEKYWALNRRLELLCAPTLRAKLARRLLEERAAQGGDRFMLGDTRETLAAELGVNRSALSRELGFMRRDGLLRASRGSFELLDVPALRRIAED